jgi:predicted RNase H-like HicB family nuclease
MHRYHAVAEPDDAGGFWISFPRRDGIRSAATSADQIVSQARDALASVAKDEDDGELPLSIEEGAMPPTDLTGHDNPLVIAIPFEVTARAAA